MEYATLGIMAAAVGILFLVMAAVRMGAEWLLNLCVRGVLGAIGIFFVNSFLAKQGISTGVGINAVTILTSGILGFPGVLALYGVGLVKIL